tara:strand:+ start:1496 stop:1906 length:411 start_codon:yes stop_codon:yes gene_type:complete
MLTEILSGLWIGSIQDAYNEDYYKDNLIDIVINCTVDQGFLDLPNMKKIRIPITSELSPNKDMFLLRNNIDSILKFIHENIEGNNIFIFCYDGINISALIVALYLIKYGGISTDTIRDILRSKNESICLDFDLSMF